MSQPETVTDKRIGLMHMNNQFCQWKEMQFLASHLAAAILIIIQRLQLQAGWQEISFLATASAD